MVEAVVVMRLKNRSAVLGEGTRVWRREKRREEEGNKRHSEVVMSPGAETGRETG